MFRELFDIAPDAMLAVDGAGVIVRVNSQAEKLFGYDEGALLGRPIEVLLPERARSAHKDHVARYSHNPRVRPMGAGQELVGLRSDGAEFPVEVALSPVRSEDNSLYVAAIRDISETQRARQALVRARHDSAIAQIGQLLLAAPNLGEAIEDIARQVSVALRVQGVALAFKDALHERIRVHTTLGVPRELVDALNRALPSGLMDALAADGKPHVFDPSLLANDAGRMFATAAVAPLLDPTQPLGGLLVFSQEAREFEHDAMHFLQSFALMLTSAIQRIRTQEQLSHAQRLEAVGQLTGGIAHDFNNLLTIISGNLQILEDELADKPDTLEVLQAARRASARGSDLTRKLLAFARRQQLSPQVCRVDAILEDLGGLLRRTLGDAIELDIVCPPDAPAIFVDPGQLEAALVNLAINARDAMPRGGRLSIAVTVRDGESGGPAAGKESDIVLSVRDTGIGMSPEVLAHAFEPFFTTKGQHKGTGLGLSMVYGFVTQSGGRLTIESKLGYGTCIELHLPAAAPALAVTARNHAPQAGRLSPGTILVVEDEPDVRDVALRFLRSLGYVGYAARNAEQALEMLHTLPAVTMVFSDIMLGSGMTGVALAHRLRETRPDLPVLLTSGDERSLRTEAYDDSVYELLPKPYLRDDLAAALVRATHRWDSRDQ
ncbi:MAG TPA: PAS domain S-box protein [Dyella sp.]|uniref:PAS domain S-box protein n=1 Tax=Dyella sp. TaxID=1869338 RepID=UPI002F921CBD